MIRSKPKTVRKRRMVIALDKACRKAVVEYRDHSTCQRCAVTHSQWDTIREHWAKVQWAHVHTRRYYATRWEPDNCLALCDACHVWFDNHKVLSYEWFRKKWPDRWENLQNVLRVSTKTTDAWVKDRYQEMKQCES